MLVFIEAVGLFVAACLAVAMCLTLVLVVLVRLERAPVDS
jgi:hypothetical protein